MSFSLLCFSILLFLNKNRRPARVWTAARSQIFVAQRSYPDLRLGFLLCFFCLLTNVFIIFSSILSAYSASLRFNFPTKNPPVRAGSFALFMLSKPKIPDLDRAALLGFLGERYCSHDTSFTDNANEFNAPL